MKVQPKMGTHQINPEWQAKSRSNLNTIVSKSLPIRRGVGKSTFSSKIPDKKEATRASRIFERVLERGKR